MSLPRPEHPRPDRFRSDWINLNGTWQFKFDPGVSGREQNWQAGTTYDQEITVPFCMESDLSGLGYKDFMPAVWYRRTFSVPDNWTGRRVLLHIGACDYLTSVYINGKSVGKHLGGYSSFSFNLTPFLNGKENVLVIEARDDLRSRRQPGGKQCPDFHSRGCSYTRTTGIWQTVWLEAVPQTYIGQFKIHPDIDNNRVSVMAIPAGSRSRGTLTASVKVDGKTIVSASCAVDSHPVYLMIDLPEVVLWKPGQPFLYDLNLQLATSSGVDDVSSYFGMRKIHTAGRKIFLNNEPFYMRMVLDQGFYPDGIYTAPTDEALINDIKISQAVGFEGARLHQKVFEPRFLYWADKLGYPVWGEHASWVPDFDDPWAILHFLLEWREVVERDFNHPAIIGWCPVNETAGDRGGKMLPLLQQYLYLFNKTIDPSRLAIDTSGYIHHEGSDTDLYDIHNYAMPDQLTKDFQPLLEGQWEKAFKNHPFELPYDGTRPYFNSEYGGIWWNPGSTENNWGYGDRPKSEAEFIDRYRKTTQIMLDNPEICGWCYTQLYDIEQEVNGLYYYDRTPKFSPEQMAELKKINSAPAKYLEV